uniref:Uncharacterized protein n=1 Tax=Vespula pensylvanica TaxID=30213 RepID=A0A834P474_VESPE|nr:hypothetical protein H0235_007071 [Vespula pensylvanica]
MELKSVLVHRLSDPESRAFRLSKEQLFYRECSIAVVKARRKEETICRRGPHNLWLKRATIDDESFFQRIITCSFDNVIVITGDDGPFHLLVTLNSCLNHSTDAQVSVDLYMQQPPRGEIWVDIICDLSKSNCKSCNASTIGRIAAYFGVFP